MLRRIVIISLYCLYGVVVVGLLLFVFFPRDRFLLWAADFVEKQLPGFRCQIGNVNYVHPFKIRLHQIDLENSTEQIYLSIDDLLADFEKKWPLEKFHVSATMYGGIVEADVIIKSADGTLELKELSGNSLRLQEIEFLQRQLNRQLQGTLGLSGEISIGTGTTPEILLEGTLRVEQFFTKLRRPVLGFSEIDFKEVRADLNLRPGYLEMTTGHYEGKLIQGNFSGRIRLQNPWQASKLDIAGGIIPEEPLLEGDPQMKDILARLYKEYRQEAIPCFIDGTIEEPQFRFGTKLQVDRLRVLQNEYISR